MTPHWAPVWGLTQCVCGQELVHPMGHSGPLAALMTLLQEIATAEGKKAALEMSARAVREEHEDLQKELETVQLSVEAAKADVTTAQRELRTLRDKVGRLLYSPSHAPRPVQKCPQLHTLAFEGAASTVIWAWETWSSQPLDIYVT